MEPSRMDTSTFIERFNEDLGTEYQPIVQYIQHIATIKGPEYHAITEESANHPARELERSRWPEPRSERMNELMAEGTTHPGDIPVGPNQRGARRFHGAKHGKVPCAKVFRVDQPNPISPRRDVDVAGLAEVEQQRPSVVH